MRPDKALTLRVNKLKNLIKHGYLIDKEGRLIHRRVCRAAWGPFPPTWVVHHIDGVKTNNEPVNLIALPRNLHERLHHAMKKLQRMLSRAECESALKCFLYGRRVGSEKIEIVIKA